MVQKGLTIIVEILPGHEKELEELLDRIGSDINDNGIIDFYCLKTVHFLRWVVLNANKVRGRETPAQLILSTNYDGSTRRHLAELTSKNANGIAEIYQHCIGFPAGSSPDTVADYLLKHRQRNAAFYVGAVGRSVGQIHKEIDLREQLSRTLQHNNPTQNWSGTPPEKIHSILKQDIQSKQSFSWCSGKYNRPFLQSFGIPLLFLGLASIITGMVLTWIFATWIALGSSILALSLVALWWALLRRREKLDAANFSPELKDPSKIALLNLREDYKVQNQITHLVEVKPGLTRQFTLRLILGAINLLARTVYNKGSLGGIPSIHFARWAIIDGGRRLIFFSNFDGSWESYLGEFIDRAPVGLTGVWSNTEGFPPTKNLIGKGAKQSAQFKAWVRSKQIPTQVWYSAYKTTSVNNINNNTAIRKGIRRKGGRKALKKWLQRL